METAALRNLPAGLDAKQHVLLDGIRYSIDIADYAYSTLYEILLDYSYRPPEEVVPRNHTVAFSSVWTVVDSVARLSKILNTLNQELGNNLDDAVTAFNEAADIFRLIRLRNRIQHIDEKINWLIANDKQAWGEIQWVHALPDVTQSQTYSMHAIVAGAILKTNVDFQYTGRLDFQTPVDSIQLNAHDVSLSVSAARRALIDLAAELESLLAPQFTGQPIATKDIHLKVIISPPNV